MATTGFSSLNTNVSSGLLDQKCLGCSKTVEELVTKVRVIGHPGLLIQEQLEHPVCEGCLKEYAICRLLPDEETLKCPVCPSEVDLNGVFSESERAQILAGVAKKALGPMQPEQVRSSIDWIVNAERQILQFAVEETLKERLKFSPPNTPEAEIENMRAVLVDAKVRGKGDELRGNYAAISLEAVAQHRVDDYVSSTTDLIERLGISTVGRPSIETMADLKRKLDAIGRFEIEELRDNVISQLGVEIPNGLELNELKERLLILLCGQPYVNMSQDELRRFQEQLVAAFDRETVEAKLKQIPSISRDEMAALRVIAGTSPIFQRVMLQRAMAPIATAVGQAAYPFLTARNVLAAVLSFNLISSLDIRVFGAAQRETHPWCKVALYVAALAMPATIAYRSYSNGLL